MKKKIEIDILFFVLMEAIYLLFLFKFNIINIIISTIIVIIIKPLLKKIIHTSFIKYMLLIIIIILTVIVSFKIINFITFNYLKNYSIYLLFLSLFFITFLLTTKGYHHYIKSLEIASYFIMFLKIISMIFLLPNLKIKFINYNFFLNINYKQIIYALFLLIILELSINIITKKKICVRAHIFTTLNIFIIQLFTILTVGNKLFYIYQYPFVNSLRQIKYLSFFEKMEGILSYNYLLDYFFLFSFLIIIIKELFFNYSTQ